MSKLTYEYLEKPLPLKVKYDDQELTAVDYWWEDDDFIFVTDGGESYRLANAHPVSIDFGLDFTCDDTVTLEKHWGCDCIGMGT